jgi:hypothetical protein
VERKRRHPRGDQHERPSRSEDSDGGLPETPHFFEPQELFTFLEQHGGKANIKEERVTGYRVKVEYQHVHEAEQKDKREAIAQVVIQSMRRMRGSS